MLTTVEGLRMIDTARYLANRLDLMWGYEPTDRLLRMRRLAHNRYMRRWRKYTFPA